MNIVHALQPLGKSIFLAGPTPRSPEVPSWRPRALDALKELGFDGTVFVPETESWGPHDNYDNQIDWELKALDQATVIAFWIPRDLDTMPAFTTNVEFGLFASSKKVVVGWPSGAPKMNYLLHHCKKYGIPVYGTLENTMWGAREMVNNT